MLAVPPRCRIGHRPLAIPMKAPLKPSALSRLNIRIDWPQMPQRQGASGENRVRRPIEPMRRRRWGVCGQPCGAGARRPWALALVVNVCSHTLSSSLRAHNALAGLMKTPVASSSYVCCAAETRPGKTSCTTDYTDITDYWVAVPETSV